MPVLGLQLQSHSTRQVVRLSEGGAGWSMAADRGRCMQKCGRPTGTNVLKLPPIYLPAAWALASTGTRRCRVRYPCRMRLRKRQLLRGPIANVESRAREQPQSPAWPVSLLSIFLFLAFLFYTFYTFFWPQTPSAHTSCAFAWIAGTRQNR